MYFFFFLGFVTWFPKTFVVICCGVEGVGSVNGRICYGGWVLFFVICTVVDGKLWWAEFLRFVIARFMGCWWW